MAVSAVDEDVAAHLDEDDEAEAWLIYRSRAGVTQCRSDKQRAEDPSASRVPLGLGPWFEGLLEVGFGEGHAHLWKHDVCRWQA